MKRIILIILAILVVGGGIAAWIFLGPGTDFTTESQTLYIRSNAATKKAVIDSLKKNRIVSNTSAFELLAGKMNYWTNIKPGKYEIRKGSSLLSIVRMLRNGRQSEVNLVITKIRTKEDFARMVGRRFECDSAEMMNFLSSSDSLQKFETDPAVSMWNVLPDKYTYFWNSTPSTIYRKIYEEAKDFWTEERKKKAAALGLTPLQAYVLASIIEEETTNNKEKDTIASVYLNRINKNMPLQADPTLKFAVKDFSIKWIHGSLLDVESPFNTYKYRGLPPGPICTPSKTTIDEVLKAPQTTYLYFVANSHLNGHLFSSSFEEHRQKAAAYREEDKLRREKQEQNAGK